jgi:hypothetical protein
MINHDVIVHGRENWRSIILYGGESGTGDSVPPSNGQHCIILFLGFDMIFFLS